MSVSVSGITTPSTAVTDVLRQLLELAHNRLTAKPYLTSLAPGVAVALDDCCKGQMWARVSGIAPMMLTTKATPSIHCAIGGWRVSAALGISRCVHAISDRGRFPTNTEMGNDFDQIMLDMEETSTALLCDFPQLPVVSGFTLGRWAPHGPEAMCAGGEWTFDFTLPFCGCPDNSPAPLGPAPVIVDG